MSEVTINERLKFLIEKYGLSVRAFSTAIGATDTNTRNYIDRGSKPNAEYLGKLLKRFNDINPTWLLLGEGEPFLEKSDSTTSSAITAHKNKGNIQSNTGSNNTITNNVKLDNCQRDLATAQKEIALLTSQLADKERTIQILLKQNA